MLVSRGAYIRGAYIRGGLYLGAYIRDFTVSDYAFIHKSLSRPIYRSLHPI